MRRAWTLALIAALATGSAPVAPAEPVTAPDQIAFVSTREADSRAGLWLLSSGAAPRFLANESGASAVSGDGHRFAFWSRSAMRLRAVVSDDTGRNRRVVLSEPARAQPASLLLSADGRTLLAAFHPRLDEGLTVERVDIETDSVHVVPIRCAAYSNLGLAGDASRIACLAPDERHVTVTDASGRALFSLPGGTTTWLSGRRIAISNAGGTAFAVYDDAGRVAARYRGTIVATSRDGRLLAISGVSLRLVDDSYRVVRTIRRPAWGPDGSVSFSPDAREIVYSGSTGAVRITRISDGVTTRVPGVEWQGMWTLGGAFVFMRVLSNGRLLVEEGDHFGRHVRTIARSWADDHGGSEIIPLAGTRVVFFSEFRRHADLWVVHSDGSGLQRLTLGADISGPAWSPNGDRLAYIRADGPPSGNCGFCGGVLTIASPSGRPNQKLVAGDGGPDLAPSWSPAGTALAVEHNWAMIQVLSLGSERRRQVGIPSGRAPAWSPRGSLIAYAARDGIRAVSTDGTNDHLLLRLRDQPSSIAWSPDGGLVAFATSTGLYLARPNGSSVPHRLPVPAGANAPSFSPDGRIIVFSGRAESGLYVVGIDGSGLRRIVPFVAASPTWRRS